MSDTMQGWIGVDLDGTLAHYDGWVSADHIGPPIPRMVHKVKRALQQGKEVRIFTARVGVGRGFSDISQAEDNQAFADHQRALIQDWTKEHLGVVLDVTAQKDWAMVELWDDRARQVAPNTGEFVEDIWKSVFTHIYEKLGGVLLSEEA